MQITITQYLHHCARIDFKHTVKHCNLERTRERKDGERDIADTSYSHLGLTGLALTDITGSVLQHIS